MPFVRLSPCGIVKPQGSDATFYSRSSRPPLGERWPSRLVATAEEDRLNNFRATSHVVAALSRAIAIYELP
jgi:hypothetical protein